MPNGTELHGHDALRELARRAGIADESIGRRGEPRSVPRATLRALLAGLGFAAQTDVEVASALASFDEEPWLNVLPAVQVVRAGEPFEIDVRLPSSARSLSWRLLLEAGAELPGEASCADFPLVGEHPTRALQRRRLKLGALPMGYHRLEVAQDGAAMSIIAAPERCWLPSRAGDRYSGVSAQLYLLRSRRNWGIGDFDDLRDLAKMVAGAGGDAVGLNPLHAPFADNPAHASPYSPSSRLLLNVLNIAVESVPEYASSARTRALVESADFRARLQAARSADLVDFESVARAKLEALSLLFDDVLKTSGVRMQRFAEFRAARGAAFERHCVYSALRQHLAARGRASSHWREWPDSLGDSASRQVAEFAREHARDVEREAWLQFVADEQLAQAVGPSRGLAIGLYRDLAVGSDASGAETWSDPHVIAQGVHIGAPPDSLSATGQNWGLPPWNPRALDASAYRSFVNLVRANMRHAGALRIDHVMALERLFWIPEGGDARDAAYVRYPREALFAIVALESQRAQCMVIGEDLGTVPPGFRERMAAANMLSYRVVRFENEDGRPTSPARYPSLALAVAGNHDLPTLKGWWEGADLELQTRHGALTAEQAEQARQAREDEKAALLEALRRENLLADDECSFEALRIAVHRFLGRTRSVLALAQIEDIAGQRDPVNVPSVPEYSSWRRRITPTLEDLDAEGAFTAVLEALTAERRPLLDGAARAG